MTDFLFFKINESYILDFRYVDNWIHKESVNNNFLIGLIF